MPELRIALVNNYEFLASWVAERSGRSAKALDYGCGAGQIVALLRERGIEAFGCDAWYGGGDHSGGVPQAIRPYVSGMDGNHAPYPDATFDFLVSNMVLEHVEDLEATSAEIARIVKPGGQILHLFPDRSTWREGHCDILFLHRLPKGRFRVRYAAAMRAMGLCRAYTPESPMEWAERFCHWIDDWTHYRTIDEIHAAFAPHSSSMRHIEENWFSARFGARRLPRFAKRLLVRKLGGIAIELERAHSSFVMSSTITRA